MPTLQNPRHERFAQAFASGMSAAKAYVDAGYKPHNANPLRLSRNESVAARIAEIVSATADRAEITIERTLRELGKIGFADIRSVVQWRAAHSGKDSEVGAERHVVHDFVLVDSDKIPEDAAAAISEVSQSKDGTVRVKMHSKQAALESILRQLERGKGADMAVDEKAEQPPSGPNILDAREAFEKFGGR